MKGLSGEVVRILERPDSVKIHFKCLQKLSLFNSFLFYFISADANLKIIERDLKKRYDEGYRSLALFLVPPSESAQLLQVRI
jgi:hypothetical protein